MEPRQILIADDDVDALRLIGLMLERQGYQILAASNGQQALDKAIEAHPALVILDVMMPDISGYEVAAKLRSHPATESIPILMFSARNAVNDRIAGFQAGADDYLTKPVRPGELITRVEALLARQTHPDEESKRSDIIGFLPTKGGLGTSTLVLNTAIELARMHQNASSAVVELLEGNGTLGLQLGLDPAAEAEFGLSVLLNKPLSYITKETLREHMVEHPTGLRALLASPRPVGSGPGLNKGLAHTILRYLSTEYDYMLLDLPCRLDGGCREALSMCDLIIITLEPSRIGFALAQAMLDALDVLGIGREKTRVVLIHRVPAAGALNRYVIEQTLHREMIAGIPLMPDLAYESVENGKPMVEIQPHGLVAQQVRRVVQAIVGD